MADPRAVSITLSDADRATLRSWTRRRSTAQGLALRARIVLGCAEPGTTNLAVAARLGISNLTVGKWRRRFGEQGIESLSDAPRPGVPRRILDEQIERVITTTLESTPRSATHWSTRLLATELGMSRHHLFAVDLLVAQEAVGRRRLGPVLARPRNARAGLLPQPLGQQHGAPVQAWVTQINRLEFLFRPAHPLAPSVFQLPMLRT